MEKLTETTLGAFLLQIIVFGLPPIVSAFAYQWVRVPLKRYQAQRALRQLGTEVTANLERDLNVKYSIRDFILPLSLMCAFGAVTYAIVYPYFIQSGFWAGLLDEIINIFNADAVFPRSILLGRVMFYGWLGAYTYGFMIIGNRFLSYDLTPAVYYFVTVRFGLAFIVGAIVSGAVGHLSIRAGLPFDTAFGSAAITCFFIGVFPEQGVNWIAATARKILKQRGSLSSEIPLAAIQGLSIWQQSRLHQEHVENAQNLATADLPMLIVNTPFTLAQLADWIDQAILLVCASPAQGAALGTAGIRTASDLLLVARVDPDLNQLALASGLNPNGLQVLSIALRATSNIKDILHLRYQFNAETASSLGPLSSVAALGSNLANDEVPMSE
jgi:hypothetical protein